MQTADPVLKKPVADAVGNGLGGGEPNTEPPTSSSKLIYHTIRDIVVDQPLVFYTFWRSRENNIFEKRVTRPDSSIVIEGFPRCGNTFAYYAFSLAQNMPVHVGNHMHCISQFSLARRWKVPAILVMRTPRDTIVSNFIYESELPLTYHLRRYVAFHEAAIRYIDSLIVSDFPDTTTSFGRVVTRVNDRFGTNFVPMQDTAEEQRRVLAEIEKKHSWRKDINPNLTKANRASFPSAEKNSRKAMVEEMLDSPKYRDLLKRAEDAYRTLI